MKRLRPFFALLLFLTLNQSLPAWAGPLQTLREADAKLAAGDAAAAQLLYYEVLSDIWFLPPGWTEQGENSKTLKANAIYGIRTLKEQLPKDLRPWAYGWSQDRTISAKVCDLFWIRPEKYGLHWSSSGYLIRLTNSGESEIEIDAADFRITVSSDRYQTRYGVILSTSREASFVPNAARRMLPGGQVLHPKETLELLALYPSGENMVIEWPSKGVRLAVGWLEAN